MPGSINKDKVFRQDLTSTSRAYIAIRSFPPAMVRSFPPAMGVITSITQAFLQARLESRPTSLMLWISIPARLAISESGEIGISPYLIDVVGFHARPPCYFRIRTRLESRSTSIEKEWAIAHSFKTTCTSNKRRYEVISSPSPRNLASASVPGPIESHINVVMKMADVTHQEQVAPMTKGSKKVK